MPRPFFLTGSHTQNLARENTWANRVEATVFPDHLIFILKTVGAGGMEFKSLVVAALLLAVLFGWYAWLEAGERRRR